MPHLYLPAEHNDADLMLAADVAAAVSSADLYVTWTLEAGAGAPEVEAIMREEREPRAPNPFTDLFRAIGLGIASIWRHIVTSPEQRPAAKRVTGTAGRSATGEPSF
jgi:hypothetical protein